MPRAIPFRERIAAEDVASDDIAGLSRPDEAIRVSIGYNEERPQGARRFAAPA